MSDHIIKAARSIWGESAILPFAELERFYAIAYAAGMERAAEICEEVIEHPAGHNGQWEGYGPVIAPRDGKACAAAIRAHAKNPPKNKHDGGVV